MNLKNSINVDTLDKITKRITYTLLISLLPFFCYLVYLYCGNYKNISILVVIVFSVLIFINLILVIINYLSIYKSFSTGFFSTYKNNTNVDLDEILLLKNLENTDVMKLLSSIHRLMVNIDLIYLIMLIMFTQGLMTVFSVVVKSSNAIYFFITIVIATIATFIFNKMQRNKTQDTLLDLFKVKE